MSSAFDGIPEFVRSLGFQVNHEDRSLWRLELGVTEPMMWTYDDLHRAHRQLTERYGQTIATDFCRGLLRFYVT